MSRVERNASLYDEDIREEVNNGDNSIDGAADQSYTGGREGKNAEPLTWRGRLMLYVGRTILALMLILCMLLMLPKFLGIKTYLVASGSMEPTIPVGSMIYSREVNPVNLEEGDIIVFLKQDEDNVPITHRVMNNDTGNKTLVTKGDANANSDPMPILYNNVIGKVIWHTPALGIISAPLTNPIGKLVMVLVAFEGFLLAEVGSRKRKKVPKSTER